MTKQEKSATDNIQKYWVVTKWESSPGGLTNIFYDHNEANIEASRRAQKYPGNRYTVLEAVGSVLIPPPASSVVVPLDDRSEHPR